MRLIELLIHNGARIISNTDEQTTMRNKTMIAASRARLIVSG